MLISKYLKFLEKYNSLQRWPKYLCILGTVPLYTQSSAAREPVLHLSHDWITDTEETGLESGFHQEGDLDLQMWKFQQKLNPE